MGNFFKCLPDLTKTVTSLKRPLLRPSQNQRRMPEAAATLRSRTAGSKGESPCTAIHKFNSNGKGAQARLPPCGRRACATENEWDLYIRFIGRGTPGR